MNRAFASLLNFVPEPLLAAVLGRLPNAQERAVISHLQRLIATAYDASQHEDFLRRIFTAAKVEGEYSSTGTHWQYVGFQQSNPASDVRGGGVLSLQCITYFLEKHPSVAVAMVARRDRGHGESQGYPWATAGIVLTRLLATIFGVIQPSGAPVRQQEKQVFWNLLQSEDDFFRLFCCMFVVLDNIWEQENATYMDFPRIQAMTEQRFRAILATMPASVAAVEELVSPELVERLDYMSLPDETAEPATERPREVPTVDDPIFAGFDYSYENQKVDSAATSSASNAFWLESWPAAESLAPSTSNGSLRCRNPVMVV
jgi:hypothetical protein